MTRGLLGGIIIALLAAVLITGCGKSISDEQIETQVSEYLRNYKGKYNVPFSDYFRLEQIVVKDKMVQEAKCIALCTINLEVTRVYVKDSAFEAVWDWLVGRGVGHPGETKAIDIRFVFERFETGWRIKGPEQFYPSGH